MHVCIIHVRVLDCRHVCVRVRVCWCGASVRRKAATTPKTKEAKQWNEKPRARARDMKHERIKIYENASTRFGKLSKLKIDLTLAGWPVWCVVCDCGIVMCGCTYANKMVIEIPRPFVININMQGEMQGKLSIPFDNCVLQSSACLIYISDPI